MTKSRALVIARLELGPTAWVEQVRRNGTPCFRVGVADGIIPARQILAEGASWGQAVEDAIRQRRGVDVRLLREELELLLSGEVEHLRARFEGALAALDYLDKLRDKGLG